MPDAHDDPSYLLVTAGSSGDIYPFVSLGRALQAMGRRVTVISSTYHADGIRAAGLPVIGLGTIEDYLRIVANPDLWHPFKGFRVLFGHYHEGLRQAVQALRPTTPATAPPEPLAPMRPPVVIAHPLVVPAAVAARELGWVSQVVVAWLAPANLRSVEDPMRLGPLTVPRWVPRAWRERFWRLAEQRVLDPAALPGINGMRADLGLPPVSGAISHMADTPDLSVTLFPDWFGTPASDWPRPRVAGDFQFLEAPGEGVMGDELRQFLETGDAPIVFTPGTGNVHAAAFFDAGLAAALRLGRRAIFLTRERAQVPEVLPSSVLWQPYVPLAALLPKVAALVHHGGIGTTAEALRAGVPQVIAAFAWDQFDNAARVQGLGVGVAMRAAGIRSTRLARVLARLLNDDATRSRAAALAAREQRAQTPMQLCADLEQALGQRTAG